MIKVGDSITVSKHSVVRKSGLVFLEKARAITAKVDRVYSDGRVRVLSGDVWAIKQGKDNQWSAVR